MPTRQFVIVTIEFAGAASFTENEKSDKTRVTREIRLVEVYAGISRSFTLYDGNAPAYILSDKETEQLDHLLGQIVVKAPWQEYTGFDGTDYELTLLGGMSSMTFRWWMKVPAEWEQVGDLFEYVLVLAKRCSGERR